jgi:hypothetical protein
MPRRKRENPVKSRQVLKRARRLVSVGDLFIAGASLQQIADEHGLTEDAVKGLLLQEQQFLTTRLQDLSEQLGSRTVARLERLIKPWYLRALQEAESRGEEGEPPGSTATGILLRLLNAELDWKKALGTSLIPTSNAGDLEAFNEFEQTIVQKGTLYRAATLAMSEAFLNDASIPIDDLYKQQPDDDLRLRELADELGISSQPPTEEEEGILEQAASRPEPASDIRDFIAPSSWAADLEEALAPSGSVPDGEVAD